MTCFDNNECTANITRCEHICTNVPGSFICDCRHGYQLDSNGYSCKDINECATHNGGCSHICANEVGSFRCECPSGYRLQSDGLTCKDVDECSTSSARCSQNCQNTVGSYRCSCNNGYRLGANGITCEDIDDCVSVLCQNGGRCVDNVASYTCECKRGFTGRHCENDINECNGIYNGGCEETCINTVGSFSCACTGNKTLLSDGLFCSGGTRQPTVFEKQSIVRRLLPRGCSTVELTRCKEGIDLKLSLSSTSTWYQLKTNSSVLYTQGIVFVELNDLSLPVSMTGMEILKADQDFIMTVGSLKYSPVDGNQTGSNTRQNCWSFAITPRDIHDFLTSLSFLKTFFEQLENFLPKWISFSHSGSSLFELLDLRTEMIYGRDVANDVWCRGAPVQPNHLYNVFKFGGEMTMSIYGDRIQLPQPINGTRFCFIVDICQDYGGSIFLMLPEESRDLLEKFSMFQDLKTTYNLRIRPRGIGLSLLSDINVHSQTTELQLWNGDNLFNYPVFPYANLWIGGDAKMEFYVFKMHGRSDIFFKMPAPWKLFQSVFIDKWNLLMTTEVSADMVIRFKLFGRMITIPFQDLGVAKIDLYASLGGMNPRNWCGPTSNPPGIFLSLMVGVNPFRNVPILKDWVFDLTARFYVFFTSDPASHISSDNNIDILSDVIQLDQLLIRFKNLTMITVNKYALLLQNESMSIVNELSLSVSRFSTEVQTVMKSLSQTNGIINIDWESVGKSFSNIWNDCWIRLKNDTRRFVDSTEFNTRVTKYNFTQLFWSELDRIELNLKNAFGKLKKQLVGVLQDYEGLGFRFKATLKIFHLKVGEVDIEAVHSISSLGTCGKFKEVFKVFENERSFRFMATLSTAMVKLGFFLHLDIGAGIGMALSIDTPNKFMLQMHAQASILGISASCDVFMNNKGLYFFVEGNLWNVFLARLKVSSVHGRDWGLLTYHVHGELLGNAGNDNNFQDSYMDALRNAVKSIGDKATKRLTEAQNKLTSAQSGLTTAQDWLESKKSNIRSANSAFDNAVRALDRVKGKLEAAKGPFRAAVAKLNQAQRKVDNLCRIETCSRICVPGIKCRICHKKIWFVNFPYPCCHFTSCMFSFPNPICVAKNLACRAIRGVAYLALEAAKLFVRAPMLALDVAKAAVSVAQVVVDKSRVVLDIAIAAVDLAQLGLEGAKGVLELAKVTLEGVKQVMKLGFKIVDLILKYGLQSLIDVKNCSFDIEMSTRSLPVFEVGCEVNALRLGWKTVKIGINFNRPIQSLWEAAKATIKFITDSIGDALFGRKRRDLLHESLLKAHKVIRASRELDVNMETYELDLNETIDTVFQTPGFENTTVGGDYENRVETFRRKCAQFRRVISFLGDANDMLFDIANETYTTLKSASDIHDRLDDFDIEKIQSNFSLENSGIDPEVAMRDYNISLDELNNVMGDVNASLRNDSLLSEVQQISEMSKSHMKESSRVVDSIRVTDQWVLAMENVTIEYFEEDVCVSFLDCAHYSITELLDLYYAEDFENVSEIFDLLSSIEDTFLELISNSSHPIRTVYNLSAAIGKTLTTLEEMNPYCSTPPTILTPLENKTAAAGGIVQFYCNVSGDPEPTIWWFKDDEYITGANGKFLIVENITDVNTTHRYKCVAGNVVANLTSDDAYLNVEDEVPIVQPIKNSSTSDKKPSYTSIDVTAKPDVLTQKIESVRDEETDLWRILVPTLLSVAVLSIIAGVVVWRCYVRHKFRKENEFGSFMSMSMVKPMAVKPAYRENSQISITPIETLQ